MSLLNRLFGSKPKFDAAITPAVPFFAIGDVHGCLGKMQTLLQAISAKDAEAPIIFVGDYVDRGEQSAQVLAHVMEMDANPNVTCLIGNHEEMMLSFLDDPQKKGARWLRYGGLQTLASFGVRGIATGMKGEALDQAASGLREAMGDEMIAWLRALPTHWVSGNIAVVHAAADPGLPMSEQSAKTLRWGHPDFEDEVRTDGTWVLHGHTIVDQAHMTAGRIAIDTGAYATGRLTAAHVTAGDVTFISV
mgnify:CR=1 FL=1